MSWHRDQIRSFVQISSFVSVYGIAGLLVLYFGSRHGLSLSMELVTIGLILLTWPFAVAVGGIVRRWRGKKKSTDAPPEPTAPESTKDDERETIKLEAHRAVTWLRESKLGDESRDVPEMRLPWMLVAGPDRAGKTTLLNRSGLEFHLRPSARGGEPSQSPTWSIADTMVFIDVPGKFNGDSEWTTLIDVIAKFRPARPVDGLLLVVSAQHLSTLPDDGIDTLAKELRTTIDTTVGRMNHRFPVYLVFTHLDLIPGFAEFFADLPAAERAAPWGATFPLEKAADAGALFGAEFDYLVEALSQRRLFRLHECSQPDHHLPIFGFPHQFADLRTALDRFARGLCKPNPFRATPLWRGFFLTAGGGAYFSGGLFSDVLDRDRHLAERLQTRRPRIDLGLRVAVGIALFFPVLWGMLFFSYLNNRALLAEAKQRAMPVRDEVADGSEKRTEATDVSPRLDRLRETVEILAAHEGGSPPPMYRFGLYAGNLVAPAVRTVYFDAVSRTIFPRAVERFERGLAATANTEAELGELYDRLKAYVMLGHPERTDPVFLERQLAALWDSDRSPFAPHLALYAAQAAFSDAPHHQPDAPLVDAAAKRLESYPPRKRLYQNVIAAANTKAAGEAVTLDGILQGSAPGIFQATITVPGAFTRDGYSGHVDRLLDRVAEQAEQDDWVLGKKTDIADLKSADRDTLRKNYFQEYAKHWHRFLQGITIAPFVSRRQAIDTLRLLSEPDSPMLKIAAETARQTDFGDWSRSRGWWEWFRAWFGGNQADKSAFVGFNDDFRPLRKLTEASGKEEAPGVAYRAALRLVADKLEKLSDEQFLRLSQKSESDQSDPTGLAEARAKIAGAIGTSGDADISRFLMLPLDALHARIVELEAGTLESTWRNRLAASARRLETGFPFSAAATNVPAGEFGSYFAELTEFSRRAESLLDGEPGNWTARPGTAGRLSPNFISYLNQGHLIARSLFPDGSRKPRLEYGLQLQPIRGSTLEVTIDGATLRTDGSTPQAGTFVWPAAPGQPSGVTIKAYAGNGTPPTEIAFPGEWGLFRMVREGHIRAAGPHQFVVSLNLKGIPVRMLLTPTTEPSLFDLDLTTFRAPEKMHD